MTHKRLVAVLACSVLISCGENNTVALKPRNFEKAVPSGLRALPQARQMEELFGPAKHAIRNLREDQVTAEWQTTVLFWGRYELSMTSPVRLSSDFGEIKEVLGAPEFQLLEMSAITDAGRGAMYDPQGGRHLNADEWAKIYRAKGDFSAVGITLKKNAPVRDFDKYKKVVLRPDRETSLAPIGIRTLADLKVGINPGFVQIRGGSTEFYRYGSLSTLHIVEKPDVLIAIVFSNPVRIEPGASGNKDDNSDWRAEERALESGKTKPIGIEWEYSAQTQKLVFNGVTFDVPFDRIAVMRMKDAPEFQLQTKTNAAIQAQRERLR